MVEQLKLEGGFKVVLNQMMNNVSVTFCFEADGDADAYLDWLAQALDNGEVVIRFKASIARVG